MEYILKRKEDLEKAIDLNPEDEDAPEALRLFILELIEVGILEKPFEGIARTYEKVADYSVASGDTERAFKHYHASLQYYTQQVYINEKDEHKDNVDRIVQKIIELSVVHQLTLKCFH